MSLTPELLYEVLSKRDDCKQILSVERVDSESATGKFQNFLSQVSRLRVHVRLKNGETKSVSIIVKKGEIGVVNNGFKIDRSFFLSESKAYAFLNKIKEWLKVLSPNTEQRWADCYHSSVESNPCLIILQDLNEIGYIIWPKGRGLFDADHAFTAMESLGKFHAITRLYIANENPDPHFFPEPNFRFINDYVIQGFQKVAQAVKIYKREWEYISEYIINEMSLSVVEKYMECCNNVQHDLPVLILSDCGPCNILYKYSSEGKPISARFIDFQFSGINSIAYDLSHFLYFSILPRFRIDNYDALLTCYQNSFAQTIDDLRGDINLIPSIPQIHACLDKMLYCQFIHSSIGAVDLNSATDEDYQRNKDKFISGSHSSIEWYLRDPEINGYIDNIKYFETKGLFKRG